MTSVRFEFMRFDFYQFLSFSVWIQFFLGPNASMTQISLAVIWILLGLDPGWSVAKFANYHSTNIKISNYRNRTILPLFLFFFLQKYYLHFWLKWWLLYNYSKKWKVKNFALKIWEDLSIVLNSYIYIFFYWVVMY